MHQQIYLRVLICAFLFCAGITAKAQIGINNFNPDSSAALDVTSSDKGLLIPRMTELQRTGIQNPAQGLLVFQTDQEQGFYYNAGTPSTPSWVNLGWIVNSNGDAGWELGNVGIGTSAPDELLDIQGTSPMETGVGSSLLSIRDNRTTTGDAPNYLFSLSRQNSNTEALYIGNDGNNDVVLAANNKSIRLGRDLNGTFSEYLRVGNNGNVGIGTNNPTRRLVITSSSQDLIGFRNSSDQDEWHIRLQGAGNADLGFSESGAADNRLVLESGGNVGIGFSNPSQKLDVNGSIRSSSTIYAVGDISANGKIQEDGNALIPAGVIVMWSGSTIPIGWALCNGSNGTPDLRNRFIVGSGSSYATGNTGGSSTHTHSVDPPSTGTTTNGAHDHSINISSITASICTSCGGSASLNPGGGFSSIHVDPPNYVTNDNGDHAHTVNIGSFTSGSSDNRPPYYALAFIMKL